MASGSYALCGIGEHVPELVFGHASKDPLAEVWKDNPVLREIRDGMPRRLGGICGECLMRGVCLGSCIAQNYYRDRDLWAPFWFCEEAERLGLFPESRRLMRPESDSRKHHRHKGSVQGYRSSDSHALQEVHCDE
jgi:radical SAM protein with 4Fe4S-binding SPASM domain